MQTQRTVDGTPSPDSTFVALPLVPRRSARRASERRATARQRKDDVASSGYREPRTQHRGRLKVDADDFPRFPVGTPPKGVVSV